MQLQQFLDRIEDTTHGVRLGAAGDLLDASVGHEDRDQARAVRASTPAPECNADACERLLLIGRTSISERSIGASWRERKGKPSWIITAASSALSMAAQNASSKAADEDRLIDERIQRAAKPAPSVAKSGPAGCRRSGDDQDLEIGSMRAFASQRRREHI